ncbi:hypothetical protein XNC3_2500002 [Xenorhabdus nematophila F1]|nr:hypothetical protein XNC3_2500002 [Xenorhabdus nematophila F1]
MIPIADAEYETYLENLEGKK